MYGKISQSINSLLTIDILQEHIFNNCGMIESTCLEMMVGASCVRLYRVDIVDNCSSISSQNSEWTTRGNNWKTF